MKPRINFYEQIKRFFEMSFHSDRDFTAHHISLYMFLLNQNNRSNWSLKIKVSLDLGMFGSKIGSKRTYYKTLSDLNEWGLISLEMGKNAWKSPTISIVPLSSQGNEVPHCQIVEVQKSTTTEDANEDANEESSGVSSGNLVVSLQHPNKDIRHKTLRHKTDIFVPPTLKEVEDFCKEKGYTLFDCKTYLKHRNDSEWVKANDKKVKNWKRDLVTANTFGSFQRQRTAEELEYEAMLKLAAECAKDVGAAQ